MISANDNDNDSRSWALYSFAIIVLVCFLIFARWSLLPDFIDIYYHLLTARGFNMAGGYTSIDFLQCAPGGRVNLYPPLFHLLLAGLMKCGLPPLGAARLTAAAAFPLFLAALWRWTHVFFHERLAFFSVLLASSVYSLYLACGNFIPATLACVLGLEAMRACRRGKTMPAAVLLGMAFYTHPHIPFFIAVSLALYGCFYKDHRASCRRAVFLGMLYAVPLFVHWIAHARYFNGAAVKERFIIEIPLVLFFCIFSFKGIFERRDGYMPAAILACAAILCMPFYPYRFISGQGAVGIIILAAAGIDRVYEYCVAGSAGARYLACRPAGAVSLRRAATLAAIIVMAAVYMPSFILEPGRRAAFAPVNSTYINIQSSSKPLARPNDFSLASFTHIRELARIVRDNSASGDIIYANIRFMDVMLASLSGRAASGGMLPEVRPLNAPGTAQDARIIVWFKNDEPARRPGLIRDIFGPEGLVPAAETELAVIYRNELSRAKARTPVPDISYGVIAVLIAGIVLWTGITRLWIG